MFRIIIQNLEFGWATIVHANSLDDIREVLDEIEQVLAEDEQPEGSSPDTGDSGDQLWELLKELPLDCKDSDHLLAVIEDWCITPANAHIYRASVHRRRALCEEIRRRDRKS